MRRLSTELKVGLFALAILAILTYMTFKVGGFEWMKKEGYTVYVYFENIAGLDEKTKIKVAGVDAGVIEKIELRHGTARLTLRIDNKVKLYSDASAAIKATGLLGDKYLEIKIGSEKPYLKSGDTIKNVTEVVDIDDMARNLSEVSANINKLAMSLNESLGTEEAKRALRESILNLREITANINSIILSNDKRFRDVLDNINNLAASINNLVTTNKESFTTAMTNFKDFSGSLKSEGPDVIKNLNKATKELKTLVEENRTSIKNTTESLESIAKKIDSGKGTLGKLIKDDRLYESVNKAAAGIDKTIGAIDRFKTFITFQADYLTKLRDAKGYFYLTLQPRPDRYYIIGVVEDPLGRVTTKETVTTGPAGTTKVKEEKTEKKVEFTAQFARRYKDIALRIGLTENTFGLGGDYFFNNDRAKVTADIWDFSNEEEGSKKPHLRIGMDYFLFKNLFVSAGADNILNKKWRGGYAGIGVRFEDEDLKYLFGSMSRIP